jgi:hypothetical protein
MKTALGTSWVVCALALSAGCSSSASTPLPDDRSTPTAATNAESLVRPPAPAVPSYPASPPTDPCATVRCRVGTHCEALDTGATCASDDPAPADPGPVDGPFCGGIAGFECPGAGTCLDDPDDECDPASGGADCGGVCVCADALVLCKDGTVFDPAPKVCACVAAEPPIDACASARCAAGTHCEVEDGRATCTPDDPCVLVDCPPDRPRCEVADGEPRCVAAQPSPVSAPFCGGFGGFACPGAGSCVDNPDDECDPANGGADCGGLCVCGDALVLCKEGTVFDPVPEVCACVPSQPVPICSHEP